MYEIIIEFLKAQNWQFSEIDQKDAVFFGITGNNGNFQCAVDLDKEDYKFTFYSICGSNVPKEKQVDMLHLLNKININLSAGNFQMDEDGEIRFKTGLLYHNVNVHTELVENIILSNLLTMDASLPGLMGFMFGDLNISEAFELIKNNNTEVENKNNGS